MSLSLGWLLRRGGAPVYRGSCGIVVTDAWVSDQSCTGPPAVGDPTAGRPGGAGLSVVTVAIDRHVHATIVSQDVVGSPTDASTILSTIATAVVTLTSIVL